MTSPNEDVKFEEKLFSFQTIFFVQIMVAISFYFCLTIFWPINKIIIKFIT